MPRIAGSGGGGASTPSPASTVLNYAEITGVAAGVETTIVTYTSSATNPSYLLLISASGTNVAEFRVYQTATIFDKRYMYFTEYNQDFDYRTAMLAAPGLLIPPSTTVTIKVLHNRPTLGTYNAKIEALEIG